MYAHILPSLAPSATLSQLQLAVHAHSQTPSHAQTPTASQGVGKGKNGAGKAPTAGKRGAAGGAGAGGAVMTSQRADPDGPDAVGGRRRDGQYSSLYGVAKLIALKVRLPLPLAALSLSSLYIFLSRPCRCSHSRCALWPPPLPLVTHIYILSRPYETLTGPQVRLWPAWRPLHYTHPDAPS